jgi:hypothetical protein
MIDRVTAKLGRKLYEVPVGFKWFVDGLFEGSLGFGGEESAGASFVRLDGSVWTTDKDGIVPALLSSEITARMGRDPGEIYRELVREFGEPAYDRVEAPATPEQKQRLTQLSPKQILSAQLADEKIQTILTQAPGNGAPIGGLKVIAESGWFAARPSGTEDILPDPRRSSDDRRRYAGSTRATDGDCVRRIFEGRLMSEQTRDTHPKERPLSVDVKGFDSLVELALDMRSSWDHAADQVWRELDPVLWELTRNPCHPTNGLAGETRECFSRFRLPQDG